MDTQLVKLVSPSTDARSSFSSKDTPFLPALAVASGTSFKGAQLLDAEMARLPFVGAGPPFSASSHLST